MFTEEVLTEYLDEIREQVCAHCPERPPGGPPCEPLGKFCGVEMHLPRLIDSIHAVQSQRTDPYLAHNRMEICSRCAFLHASLCPCPMDYLAVLIVEAVETVDQRRSRREKMQNIVATPSDEDTVELEDIYRIYEEATGTWVGCDWPTQFGTAGLNLAGRTAAEADALAAAASESDEVESWLTAARWLAHVEEYARQSEHLAAAAVNAAAAGNWDVALQQAQRAWLLEFSTGRPLRKGDATWKNLSVALESAALAHQHAGSDIVQDDHVTTQRAP